jgi:hypothetical protein
MQKAGLPRHVIDTFRRAGAQQFGTPVLTVQPCMAWRRPRSYRAPSSRLEADTGEVEVVSGAVVEAVCGASEADVARGMAADPVARC